MNEFTCLPDGLACAPLLFTKLMKPVYATLWSASFIQWHILMIHCLSQIPQSIVETKTSPESGFTINYEKY